LEIVLFEFAGRSAGLPEISGDFRYISASFVKLFFAKEGFFYRAATI
jgi:hypothetical protein